MPDTPPRRCEACNGTGQRVDSRRDRGGLLQQITTCPSCHGRGNIIDKACADCHGRGEVEREEELTVTIAIGVEEGMALRVPGHGLPSHDPGGTPGDLLVVRSIPDARFERHGADLWRLEMVQVPDATLGTRLEVPTLDGHATVTVPPETQPDTVLRLPPRKGLPIFGSKARGDLYLRVHVHIPERLSAKERTLYERLRMLNAKKT